MAVDKAEGVIGITDDGYLIVTGRHICADWRPDTDCLYPLRECWYCAYADFRKTFVYTLQKSICRNPRRRVATVGRVWANADAEDES